MQYNITYYKTRQDKTRQGNTSQCKTRQDKTSTNKTRRCKIRQCKKVHIDIRQTKRGLDNIGQYNTILD